MFPPRSRNPPQTPPGYSPLKEAGGCSKDRSVDLIKTGRNDVDIRESNLTYQLRIGIFRVVCTNGLIVSRSAFPTQCVRHRGNIVDEVVVGALQMTERFENVAARIEQMEHRRLPKDQ